MIFFYSSINIAHYAKFLTMKDRLGTRYPIKLLPMYLLLKVLNWGLSSRSTANALRR